MLDDDYISQDAAKEAMARPIKIAKPSKEDRFEASYYAENVRQQVIQMFGEEAFYTGGLSIITPLNSEYQKAATNAFVKGIRQYDEKYGFKGPIDKIKDLDNWRPELQKHQQTPRLLDYEVAVVLDVLNDKVNIGLASGERSSILLTHMKWARSALKNPKEILSKGDVIAVSKLEQGYGLKQIPKVDGATIVMDVATGRVLAMVSGYDYKASKFDRATQAQRQPGSVIKPFIYLSALEHGYEPNTMFEDKPVEIYQGPGLPIYKPKNFKNDYLGQITMRAGLELSRNTITVQVAQKVGLGNVAEIIKRYGINDNPQKFYSMALGSLETTLDKITSAYGSIANGCNKIFPEFIEMIKDRNGQVIYRRDKEVCHGCAVSNLNSDSLPSIISKEEQNSLSDSASCYQITSMLEGVIERGTGRSAKKLSKVIAGKTGTSNESKDTWFIGFTPRFVFGTYVGFDQPTTMGKMATGGSVALPIFINLMESKPFNEQKSLAFIAPENITLVKTTSDRSPGGATIIEALKTYNQRNNDMKTNDPFEKVDSKNPAPYNLEVY
jgi:penicillin-binding protein 1A